MQLSLAEDKLSHTLALVLSLHSKKPATMHNLYSLVSDAASVVQRGHTFLQCMVDTMKQQSIPMIMSGCLQSLDKTSYGEPHSFPNGLINPCFSSLTQPLP